MLHWIRTRSRRDLILACCVAVAFFVGAGMFLGLGVDRIRDDVRHEVRHRVEHRVSQANHGGTAFDQSFDVGSVGRLEIHVGELDVAVSNESGQARVVLNIDDDEASEEALEALGFTVEARDGRLTIRTEEEDWNWRDGDDYDGSLEVTVPTGFDVFVQTGDGDVALGSFEGEVAVQTGDGDVAIGRATGDMLRVQTGDGDIALGGAVAAGQVSLHTGDGDVAAATLEAEEVTIRTGDGDINIEALAGKLEATTGDGDVRVDVGVFDGIEIRSGDGDITLFLSADISADVELHGSEFVIDDAFALPVRMDSRTVEGLLNGGGAELSVRVGDGTIRIAN